MATLTSRFGASPVNASDNVRHTFTADINLEVASFALDDMPADFGSMATLGWAVEYSVSASPTDDTYGLQIRIMNGATVLAAADSGGGWVTVNANITSTTDATTPGSGETAFAYVNAGASKATWDGASIELRQTYGKTKGADGVSVRVDMARAAGTYNVASQSAPVGMAGETDAAQALVGKLIRAVGLSTETESALTLSGKHIRAVGLSTTANSALALTARQIRTVGLATETDAALQLSAGGQAAPVGLATESDNSFALAARQITATGLSVEVDASFALTARQIGPTGLATESAQALALTAKQLAAVGVSLETSTAIALVARQITATGLATETDVAFTLATGTQSAPVGLSLESSLAIPLSGRQLIAVGLASEISQALGLTARQVMAAVVANETDTALSAGHVPPTLRAPGWSRGLFARLDSRRTSQTTRSINKVRSARR